MGNIIEVSEKFAISKDTECWTVHQKTLIKKNTEIYWKPIWFYPNLKYMIDGLLDRGFEIPDELRKLVGSMDNWAEKMVKTIDARQVSREG
jgi:hypothetical protein